MQMPINQQILDSLAANKLTELDLENIPLTTADIRALTDALQNNFSLTKLRLVHTGLDDACAKLLAEKLDNDFLVDLSIGDNNIGPEGAAAFEKNHTLKELDICDNHIGDEGAIALARSTSLVTLSANMNDIGDPGCQALLANRNLKILWLIGNEITGEGLKGIESNTSLEELNLYYNNITSRGAARLALNHTLTCLNLGRNLLDDTIADIFKNNTTLQVLMLKLNRRVTAAALAQLKENFLHTPLSENEKSVKRSLTEANAPTEAEQPYKRKFIG
jgi:Ran GTPase-activating protein (RanGAP) involved in mRNA processing and transport